MSFNWLKPYHAQERERRGKTALIIASVFVLALVVGAGVAAWQAYEKTLTPFLAPLASAPNPADTASQAAASDSLLSTLKLGLEFSGIPEAKHYLLLLQNNTELRPTGGFIGAFAVIKVEDGNVDVLWLDDSYNLDRFSEGQPRPSLPEPLRKYLTTDGWYFRDSNWSPDFPTAARQALDFYKQELPWVPDEPTAGFTNFDGVVAITPTVLERLLETFGSVSAEDKVYDAHNFTAALEYRVEYEYAHYGEEKYERKDVIGEIGKAILEKYHGTSSQDKGKLVPVLLRSLQDKQILLYHTEPDVEADIVAKNWGGQVVATPPEHDSLFLVDANLASLKSDASVARAIHYQVGEAGGEYFATTSIRYDHQGAYDWRTSQYRSASRLLVPLGSTLEQAATVGADGKRQPLESKEIATFQEHGKTVFAFNVVVKPKQQFEVELRYRLPAPVAHALEVGSYRLYVQKQPGTLAHSLSVDIDTPTVLKSWDSDLEVDRVFVSQP